jgi:lysozyme
VSFTFNVGASAFKQSTLLKRLNARDFVDVPNQLRRWNKSGGKKVQGLVNRRENEIKLWKGEI